MSLVKDKPLCTSCGVEFIDHLGVIGICKQKEDYKLAYEELVKVCDQLILDVAVPEYFMKAIKRSDINEPN